MAAIEITIVPHVLDIGDPRCNHSVHSGLLSVELFARRGKLVGLRRYLDAGDKR